MRTKLSRHLKLTTVRICKTFNDRSHKHKHPFDCSLILQYHTTFHKIYPRFTFPLGNYLWILLHRTYIVVLLGPSLSRWKSERWIVGWSTWSQICQSSFHFQTVCVWHQRLTRGWAFTLSIVSFCSLPWPPWELVSPPQLSSHENLCMER